MTHGTDTLIFVEVRKENKNPLYSPMSFMFPMSDLRVRLVGLYSHFTIHIRVFLRRETAFKKIFFTSKLSKNRLLLVRFDEVTPKKLPLLERFP